MRKRIILLALIAVLLLVTPAAASAPGIAVVVNGQPIAASAIVIDQSVFVPLRAVSEALGAEVGWDGATNTVTVALEPPPPVIQTVEKEVQVEVPVPSFDAAGIYEKAMSASYVVYVINNEGEGHGSGFAVGDPDIVVTAYHVVNHPNARIAAYTPTGRFCLATVIATDVAHDIAVLRISDPSQRAPGEPFTPPTALELATDKPRVGEEVGLISAPGKTLDFAFAMTVGRVALVSHRDSSIVIDITGAEGSSGGPLIDAEGNVVGVLVAGRVEQPYFVAAVPASDIAALLATIK